MASTTTDRLAGVTAGLASKAPVRAATTANITLSGEQTIDSVAVVADDRILVKAQTDGIENGIYDAKSGAWVRALDFDGTRDVVSGTFVVVAAGTAGAGTLWRISTADPITIGTTSISFALMTVDSVTAFIATFLDDGDAGTARTTLGAAGLAVANTFTAVNTFTKRQVWAKGGDLTSAATLVIGTDGNYFDVTGNTGPITAMTVAAGTLFMLQFDSTPTMNDGGAIDLGGTDLTTAAGDRGLFFATAANTVQLVAPFFYEADRRVVDSTGAVTNAVQPAFLATNLLQSNVTGDSAIYTVVFATEVFDQGSDFDGTSTFTAPVTGRYLLTALVQMSDLTAGTPDTMQLFLITSNDTFIDGRSIANWGGQTITFKIAMIVDMDAADTAIVQVSVAGDSGGKINDIAAGAAHFSGALLA